MYYVQEPKSFREQSEEPSGVLGGMRNKNVEFRPRRSGKFGNSIWHTVASVCVSVFVCVCVWRGWSLCLTGNWLNRMQDKYHCSRHYMLKCQTHTNTTCRIHETIKQKEFSPTTVTHAHTQTHFLTSPKCPHSVGCRLKMTHTHVHTLTPGVSESYGVCVYWECLT